MQIDKSFGILYFTVYTGQCIPHFRGIIGKHVKSF